MMLVYYSEREFNMEDLTKKYYREHRALTLSKEIGKILDNIVKADGTPEEDTSNYCNIMVVFLREIMFNTAIIADYCNNHSIPEYPNKVERSEAGDSSKETNA